MQFLKVCFLSLILVLVGTRFGELHFVLDNLSNFPLFFAAAFSACAAIFAVGKEIRWTLAAAVGVAFSLAPVLPWYASNPANASRSTAPSVKLLVSNVYMHNRQHTRLLRLVEQEQPDVVGLIEVNARWLRSLSKLREEFPYRFEVPDESHAGLALYSKLPLANSRLLKLGDIAVPAVATTMQTPTGEVELILAHTLPPLSGAYFRRRNEQLAALASHVRASSYPVVMAGDLNVTMWNTNYQSLADVAGLRNARSGHGVGSTWPPVQGIGVPIDHILATAPVLLRNFTVHPAIGSDHLPISAAFSLSLRTVPDRDTGRDRGSRLRSTGR